MGSMKMACVFFFCFLFIAAGEMKMAEARTCESASTRFNGVCARSSNCASVCQTEGFPDGKCQGLRRRCMCQRPCP